MKSILALLLTLASGCVTANDWEAVAQIDMNSASGKVYEKVAAKFAAGKLGNIMSTCMGNEMPSEFVLYFKILSNGSISEKYSSVSTPVATCFSKNMALLTWPAPPASSFVFKITMFGSM